MSKLLSANFIRLRKMKFFWIGMGIMLAAGIHFPIDRYMDMKETGAVHHIDNGFFACALFIGILMSIFCSLFIGTEYSDETIRNKIVTGQKRTSIYLSNLVTSAFVGIAMCVMFFVPYLCLGIPLLGFFKINIEIVFLFTMTVFMLSVAFSSIFTLISMLNHNKALTAVSCILLAFGLLLIGAYLNSLLNAPKVIPIYIVDEKNTPIASQELNPYYLEGEKREAVQTLYDIIPGGQAIQCTSLEAVNLPLLPVYSFIIIGLTTGIGLYYFKKKDLK